MSNTGKNIWAALLLGIFTLSVFVIDIVPTSESMIKELKIREKAKNKPQVCGTCKGENAVVLGDLPQVVKSAVISKYIAYSMENISRDQQGIYRIVLKNENARLITYYTEEGEYLRQEAVKPVQMVALY